MSRNWLKKCMLWADNHNILCICHTLETERRGELNHEEGSSHYARIMKKEARTILCLWLTYVMSHTLADIRVNYTHVFYSCWIPFSLETRRAQFTSSFLPYNALHSAQCSIIKVPDEIDYRMFFEKKSASGKRLCNREVHLSKVSKNWGRILKFFNLPMGYWKLVFWDPGADCQMLKNDDPAKEQNGQICDCMYACAQSF